MSDDLQNVDDLHHSNNASLGDDSGVPPSVVPGEESPRSADTLPRPTETFTWRYSGRDLFDETFWGVVFLAIFGAIFFFVSKENLGEWLRVGLLWVTGVWALLYWLWLGWTYFSRRACTLYTLTPQYFEYQHGFFSQKTQRIELFDIEQVNLTRTLWERILGVATLQLRVKDQTKDNAAVEYYNFRGIREYPQMQQKIGEYRTYYRTQIASTVVRG